ncbi:DUF402 domain-containing protein [Falsibacillus pallidus]|uniref:DUF402 domain-containing protein n=1 Tax=Falsibacillus pallidus TaxID=493781 RepID=A0A370G7D9_9BACI|nr:DUF402 domain-containing protein [Falsibacillus pallidus]RDI39120.1 hypothetical protein DFR59_11527 [Falsibacillus pallidus]
MLERKFGNRPGWQRILERKYAQTYLNTNEFKGYITLLNTIKVSEPLFKKYGEQDICIVDDGYLWLQQFPMGKNHAVTTMFDANGEIIQWYIDICLENSIENDLPYLDDLFLDIVLLPSGELIEKDADELEVAYNKGIINYSLYDLAWEEQKRIKKLITSGDFPLIRLSSQHKEILLDKLS